MLLNLILPEEIEEKAPLSVPTTAADSPTLHPVYEGSKDM
jgi:hypothetical protein